jgi:CcmD family protein
MIGAVFVALWTLVLTSVPLMAALQAPPGQEDFRPVSELPPAEQLPAAPLLVAAYAFVWVALMVYLWSIWRRLSKVEAEMRTLAERRGHRSSTG